MKSKSSTLWAGIFSWKPTASLNSSMAGVDLSLALGLSKFARGLSFYYMKSIGIEVRYMKSIGVEKLQARRGKM